MLLKTAITLSVTCLILTACGGGGGGGSSSDSRIALNGNLATPDDGARALSGLLLVLNNDAFDIDLDVDTSAFGPGGDPCNTSGDASLVSISGSSVTVDFDSCQNVITEDGESADVTLDGRAQVTCNDGFNTCNDARINFGDDDTALFIDLTITEDNTTLADATANLLGQAENISSENAAGDETNNSNFDVSGSINSELNNRSADFVLSQLAVTTVDFDNDSASISANGDFEITSSNNCLSGGANIATSQAFVFDENDTLQAGGQVALSNSSGERVTITASAEDELTITSVDGQSQTYTISEIEAFCQ